MPKPKSILKLAEEQKQKEGPKGKVRFTHEEFMSIPGRSMRFNFSSVKNDAIDLQNLSESIEKFLNDLGYANSTVAIFTAHTSQFLIPLDLKMAVVGFQTRAEAEAFTQMNRLLSETHQGQYRPIEYLQENSTGKNYYTVKVVYDELCDIQKSLAASQARKLRLGIK